MKTRLELLRELRGALEQAITIDKCLASCGGSVANWINTCIDNTDLALYREMQKKEAEGAHPETVGA